MSSVDRDAEGQEFRAAAEELRAARLACVAAFERVKSGDQRTLQRYVRARERLEHALQRMARFSYRSATSGDDDAGRQSTRRS